MWYFISNCVHIIIIIIIYFCNPQYSIPEVIETNSDARCCNVKCSLSRDRNVECRDWFGIKSQSSPWNIASLSSNTKNQFHWNCHLQHIFFCIGYQKNMNQLHSTGSHPQLNTTASHHMPAIPLTAWLDGAEVSTLGWGSGGPRFQSHPRLTFQSCSRYQLNQLGSETASESTFKKWNTCGVSNTRLYFYFFYF